MGSFIQTTVSRGVGRKMSSPKKSKAERLGWRPMSEQKRISFRGIIREVRSTDVSQLPERYTACPKLL